MADSDIKSISISVKTDTKAAVKNIDALVSSLSRLTDLAHEIETVGGGIDDMAKGLDSLGKIDLSKLPAQMEKIADAMREIATLDTATVKSINAQARLLAAQNRQKELSIREVTATTNAEAEARKKEMLRLGLYRKGKTQTGEEDEKPNIGDWTETNKSAASLSARVGRIGGFTGVLKDVGKGFLDVGKAGLTAAKYVGKFTVAVAKTTAKVAVAPFKKLASSVTSLTKRFTNFFAAVKRIAIYRAIRTALKEIAQGFKEGMDNLYQYSKAIDGTFAKSMDTLATSALYAKNSLGAMVAPIVNELAPAVDFLVDKFVDLLNTINETIAAMTGASTWTKALKYPVEYAEEADNATKSAKKLRATLLGFDEINRLDDNSKSNRGRGEEGLDYSKMFEEQTVSTQAGGVIKALKDAFASGDFTDIGATLGEKIKTGLDNIPWGEIKERLNKNAESVGSLLNGLVSVEGAGTSLGSTIAEVFDTAVGKLNTFFNTVHWDKVGDFLGDGINGITSSSLSKDVGGTIASIINGGVSTLNNFADKVDWDKAGRFTANGVNKAIKTTDTRALGESVSKTIAGAIKAAGAFLRDTDFEALGKKIGQFFKGIKWKEVFFSAVDAIVNGIKAAFKAVKGFIGEIFSGFGSLFSKEGEKAGKDGSGGIKKGFVGGGLISFFTGKWDDIKGIFKNVGSWFEEKFDSALKKIKDVFKGIGTWFGDRWDDIKGVFKGVGSWFSEKFQDAWREVKKPFENVGTFFATVWFSIKQKFTDIGQKIGNTVGRAFAKAINAVLEVTEGVLNTPIKAINKLLGEVNKLPGVNIGKLGTISLGRMDVPEEFAKGGTPATGSLFLAGERGAELISSNRSGTTVTNRDQLAESVEAGNAESNDLLRQGVALLQQLVAKDTTVVNEITTNSITTAMNRQNVRTGRSVVAVG